MKPLLISILLALLASPAAAGVVHDESVDGDLSSDPAVPTVLFFGPGGNTVTGTVGLFPVGDRDFFTFSIGAGQVLSGLNLLAYTPDDLSFVAFNAGTTSYFPTQQNNANFLSGILIGTADVGADLMPLFVTRAVTINALPTPELGPGNYCFVVQQGSVILQQYSLEFVVTAATPVERVSWGGVKSLHE